MTMVKSRDKEKRKLNSTVNANRGAHTLTLDKIIKCPFKKITWQLLKANKIQTKILLLGPAK